MPVRIDCTNFYPRIVCFPFLGSFPAKNQRFPKGMINYDKIKFYELKSLAILFNCTHKHPDTDIFIFHPCRGPFFLRDPQKHQISREKQKKMRIFFTKTPFQNILDTWNIPISLPNILSSLKSTFSPKNYPKPLEKPFENR